MAGNSAFQLISERGWRRGLDNLLREEFHRWWGTSLWLVQSLIWVAVINFILAGVLWTGADLNADEGATIYSLFTGMFAAVAVIIILQDAVVGEKETGTAAWILSKPVSRTAFILAKLVPNAVGTLVTMILLPGIGAYIQISLARGSWLSPMNFLAGMLVLWLYLLFYLTLTLMLGTFFNHRGPVIGLALALNFGQQYLLGLVPALISVMPYTLAVPLGQGLGSIAADLILGKTPHSWIPVAASAVFCILFVFIAARRFEKEEF